ncbi:MAG: hypothetical protein HPY66_2431 [Firmicutes bacterium]|nr:hypothetical protein [Bacillota bacterium]
MTLTGSLLYKNVYEVIYLKIKFIAAVTGVSGGKKDLQKRYLEKYISSGTDIHFEDVAYGFPSIESETHGIFNAMEIIRKALLAEEEGYDGIFVNCFDDPGVFALRELLKIPVFGGYLPSMLTALSLGERIGVITTDGHGILSEERKAAQSGFRDKIAAIEPVGLGVLALGDRDRLVTKLTEICLRYEQEYRVQAAALGCTGMYYIIDELRAKLKAQGCNIAVIEPLAAGIKFLETVIQLGFTNSLNYHLNMKDMKWMR